MANNIAMLNVINLDASTAAPIMVGGGGGSEGVVESLIGFAPEVHTEEYAAAMTQLEYCAEQIDKFNSGEITNFNGETTTEYKTDLCYIGGLDIPDGGDCTELFRSCRAAKQIDVGKIKPKIVDFMFYANVVLEKISGEIDMSECESSNNAFGFAILLEELPKGVCITNKNKDAQQTFVGLRALKKLPDKLDVSGTVNAYQLFCELKALETFPESVTELRFDSVEASTDTNGSLGQMFKTCTKLKSVPKLIFNGERHGYATQLFSDCSALTEVYIEGLYAGYTYSMFSNCKALERVTFKDCHMKYPYALASGCSALKSVKGLDFDISTLTNGMFDSCAALVDLNVSNLGKSSATAYTCFSGATNWGVATDEYPDARQSLIDTLITNSYDRASAGLAGVDLSLSETTKALLTEEEIAAITAKGFSIA